jgi:hypothetical protein
MDWSAAFAEALPTPSSGQIRHAPSSVGGGTPCTLGCSWTTTRPPCSGASSEDAGLVLNGAWCGDCINQCPIFDHFAKAATTIDLRFLDRDAREDVRDLLAINGGIECRSSSS